MVGYVVFNRSQNSQFKKFANLLKRNWKFRTQLDTKFKSNRFIHFEKCPICERHISKFILIRHCQGKTLLDIKIYKTQILQLRNYYTFKFVNLLNTNLTVLNYYTLF